MAGWRPPDSTPLEEIREARSALAGAREFLEAEQGRPGRVDLAVLTGGNSLALQLLHDALGYRTTNVQKRSARSAIAAASQVLEEVSKGRDPTVEKAVFRSLTQAKKPPTSRSGREVVIHAERQASSAIPAAAAGKSAESDQRSPTITLTPSDGVRIRPRESSSIQVRRLTADGIQRAKEFLAYMREHPRAKREPPRELLFGERYSRPFREPVRVEQRPLRTRREAAEYFAPKFEPIRHLVADHAGLWSWLGMYYFGNTVRIRDDEVRLSPIDERFVVNDRDSSSFRQRYRHYLWSSWRLFDAHGESVAYFLDQEITAFPAIMQRALGSVFIFNSVGVIQTMLRLYTANGRVKRGFRDGFGGLAKFVLVLGQLERTYDVYGMSPDALIRILPEEFRRWDSGPVLREPDAAAPPEPAAGIPEASHASATHSEPIGDKLTAVRAEAAESLPVRQPSKDPSSNRDGTKPMPPASPDAPSVRQTLLDVRARINQQGQVTWADPREHITEGTEAWIAYVEACGVPERRLFRTAFLHRLDEVLASLD